MKFRNQLRRIIHAVGYEVRPLGHARGLRTSMAEAYAHLGELGFHPTTVVDVGVASGTPELYAAFPEAKFLLIEPLGEFERQLQAICQRLRASYVLAAAGAQAGEVEFNVHDGHLDGSSIYKETMGAAADGHQISVPVIRIDDVIAEQGLSGPILIKIDAQGAELDALDGAPASLDATEVVVLEVSLFGFMSGAPQFHDVIAYMKERGFVAYDIVLGWNRPLDNALGQVDIVFVRELGMFRQDHSYDRGG